MHLQPELLQKVTEMDFGLLTIETNCECKNKPPVPIYDQRHQEFYCANCQRVLTTAIIEKKSTLFGNNKFDIALTLKKYDSKIDEYENVIDESTEKITELEDQLNAYRETIVQKDDEIKDLLQTIESLKNEIGNQKGFLNRSKKESNSDIKKISEKLIGTEKELDSLKTKYSKLSKDKEDIVQILHEKRKEISDLNDNQQELLNKIAKIEKESTSWKADYLQMREVLSVNQQSLEEAYSTNKHLRNELESYSKTDVRSITKMFLSYWTKVFNASRDKSSLQDLQEYILNMNEMLKMNATGLGIHIRQHEVGSSPSSDRLDIQSVTTTDKSLDGTVKSSDCFGCTFDSEHITEIPESISVYTFKETRLMVRDQQLPAKIADLQSITISKEESNEKEE
jgi:predicted  nucleic acid-binding Zn-ribbon protein